ncbi:MAG TPA: acyl-CoA dehydrogenase, partial [Burkholderiaceae bacterium]|nr:acyl-CoA dehydrogenase [Burkholderiaceae bacterium]
DRPGMHRKPDLELLALRGSNTAAIDVEAVEIGEADVFHEDGPSFLRAVRPGFLGLQCGMSIGLAKAALDTAAGCRADRHVLVPQIDAARQALAATTEALYEGLRSGRFVAKAAPLFELRIRLAQLVQEAVQLELQASGGRAYLVEPPSGFGRRWREAAFVPVVTPSVTQLQAELQNHKLARAA